ncbi:hypothetical protein ROT00_11300 [Agromyces mediolanus]|uniref:hypothetical protein n=1 Tax=Agromyces mediolanus TaxID=41986 RepID=UPI003836B0DE
MTTTALVFAGALLLSGCATSGSGDASAAPSGCDTIRSEVRNVSNGAQNTLATATDGAATKTYLEGLEDRVDALDEQAGDDTKVEDALEGLKSALGDAADYAATIPADGTQDADALAAQQTAIQTAASEVTKACAA